MPLSPQALIGIPLVVGTLRKTLQKMQLVPGAIPHVAITPTRHTDLTLLHFESYTYICYYIYVYIYSNTTNCTGEPQLLCCQCENPHPSKDAN